MKYKDFKIGDKVHCSMYGKGVIVDIDNMDEHPIQVKFEYTGYKSSYMINGKFDRHCNRTLFVIEREIIEKDEEELCHKSLEEIYIALKEVLDIIEKKINYKK